MLKKKLGIEATEREGLWINPYFKISSTLIIPEGVKEIGLYTFCNCEKLEKVLIPESVKYIRFGSFLDCKKLREVKIPESVKGIGNIAFCDCHRLKKVEIPEGVEEIWDCAFYGCEEATITLRKSKKDFAKIGVRAFYGVRKVKEEIIY